MFDWLRPKEGIVVTPDRAREIAAFLVDAADAHDLRQSQKAQARIEIEAALRMIGKHLYETL